MRVLHSCSVKRSGETMTVTGRDPTTNEEVKITGVEEITTSRAPPSRELAVFGTLADGEQIELL